MYYYYNEAENCFAVYANFKPKKAPKDYRQITKEEYDEMSKVKEEAEQENEEAE